MNGDGWGYPCPLIIYDVTCHAESFFISSLITCTHNDIVLFFSYLNEVEPVKVVNKIGLKHIIIADKDLHVAEWSCLMLTTTL